MPRVCMPGPHITMCVRVASELEKRLDAACLRTGQNRSNLVRYALSRYLEALEASNPVRESATEQSPEV